MARASRARASSKSERTLRDVVGRVISGRDLQPVALCLGMASVDRPNEAAAVREILRRVAAGCPTLIVNDALIALEAGAPELPGIVLLAGTGSIAYGRDRLAVRRARAAGGTCSATKAAGTGWVARHCGR